MYNDMSDFKEQLKHYGDSMRGERCPLRDAKLDRSIRRAMWSDKPAESPAPPRRHSARWLWPAAAACLAALLLPLGIKSHPTGGIARVDVDGQQVYFVCNRGCSADGTIDMINTLII